MDPVTPAPSGEALLAAAPTAATPAPANPAPVTMGSDQLATRLAEERTKAEQKVLKALGITDVEAGKTAIAAAKTLEDAKKTETEKLLGRITELEPVAKRAADLEAVVKARAESEFASLTDAQRAAVTAISGDDPAAQLKAITALRSTWTQVALVATPAAPPAPTAPPAGSPAPASPTTPNHLAAWESLRKSNPVEAARYFMQHRAAISEARAKASPTV